MKAALSAILFATLFLTACSKNEPPQSTEPADYAETRHDLIDNPAKDSINDSVKTNSAMPPQPKRDASGH